MATKLSLTDYEVIFSPKDESSVSSEPTFEPTSEFAMLEDLHFSNKVLVKKWLPLMPNLTSIDGDLGLDDDWKELLLNLKKLKSFSSYGNLPLLEQFVLDLFKRLPLTQVTFTLSKEITSDLWRKVFQIDGVLDRLEQLTVNQQGDNGPKQVKTDTHVPAFKRLAKLDIQRCIHHHSVLLYAAQSCLKDLTLDLSNVEFDFSKLQFSNLEKLHLTEPDMQNLAYILSGCHATLKEANITMGKKNDHKVSLSQDFPKLVKLELDRSPVIMLSLFLKGNGGANIVELRLSDMTLEDLDDSEMKDMTLLFRNMNKLKKFAGPLDILPMFPTENLPNLVSIRSPFSTSYPKYELNEELLAIFMACPQLEIIDSQYIKSITAENWFTRLLTACPALTSLALSHAELKASMDLSTLKPHFLEELILHVSNFGAEYRQAISEHVITDPKCSTIHIYDVPRQDNDVYADYLKQFKLKYYHIDLKYD